MLNSINILLVEDDELFRLGLCTFFSQEATIGRVVEVGDGEQALATLLDRSIGKLHELPFDIVVLDLVLPGMSGLEICQLIRKDYPDLPVLILTSHADNNLVVKLVEAGAKGYCLKGVDTNQLLLAINTLVAGATWWDAKASNSIYQAICQLEGVSPPDTGFNLTNRELQVLKLIASGKSNREIATDLFITVGTARVHVHSILQKLDANDRTQAAIVALQNHLID
jgi:two-component system, NarL family, response regulator